MSRDGEQFVEATQRVRRAELRNEGEYLDRYAVELADSDQPACLITLSPELADTPAAVDAFEQVTQEWDTASANATVVPILERDTDPRPWVAVPDEYERTLERTQGALPPEAVESVITDTAEALRTLGLYNLVHGTLSPSDIFVFRDGTETTAEVGHFGLETAVQAAVGEFEPTPYTAPELLEDPEQRTQRTDVYGLGAISYFTLTGRPPVSGDPLDQSIRDGVTVPLGEDDDRISAALDGTVREALATRPSERHDSPYEYKRAFSSVFDTAEFGDALDDAAGETGGAGDGDDAPDATVDDGGDSDSGTQPEWGPDEPVSDDGEPSEGTGLGHVLDAEQDGTETDRDDAERDATETDRDDAERDATETDRDDAGPTAPEWGAEDAVTPDRAEATDPSSTAATETADTATDDRADETGKEEQRERTGDTQVLGAVVSFFVPGVGNMLTGDTDRGATILLLYILWTVLAWGVVLLFLGTIITVLTLGFGIILQVLLALFLLPVELAIHGLAAVDAYRGSAYVDRLVNKAQGSQ